jgi:hypothetical protein
VRPNAEKIRLARLRMATDADIALEMNITVLLSLTRRKRSISILQPERGAMLAGVGRLNADDS